MEIFYAGSRRNDAGHLFCSDDTRMQTTERNRCKRLLLVPLIVMGLQVLHWGPQARAQAPDLGRSRIKTVCTVTINSADEKQAFQKYLGNQNFRFVELTDYSQARTKEERGSDWFQRACESGIQCDMIVMSGHFAGGFFGDSGFSLSPFLLEEFSCQNRCDGILKHPKEVFFFGCNTLAMKTADSRTPAQYLRVLLEDGISRNDAERIVQARYGDLGDSMLGVMKRSFSGIPRLYGFNTKAPLGKQIRPYLEQYFQAIPNYEAHLDQIPDLKSLQPDELNTVLANLLSQKGLVQTPGLKSTDAAYPFSQNICRLHTLNTDMSAKLSVIKEMLSGESRKLYIPSTVGFLKKNIETIQNDAAATQVLGAMRTDSNLKSAIQAIEDEQKSDILRVDVLFLQWAIGWLSKDEFDGKVKSLLKPTLLDLSVENIDKLCAINNDGYGVNVRLEDFNQAQLVTQQGAMALHCLRTSDERITKAFLPLLTSPQLYFVSRLIAAAKLLPGYDAEIVSAMRPFTESKILDISSPAREVILYRGAPEEKIEQVRELTKNEKNLWRVSAYSTHAKDKLDEASIIAAQRVGEYTNRDAHFRLFQTIANLTSNNPAVWERIFSIVGTNHELNLEFAYHISFAKQNNLAIAAWAKKNIAATPKGSSFQWFSELLRN